ncbi:CRISPR-associated protein Cas4 [Paenibacillus larvae]|uniref:CRISPR-associated protein Cas4 n=2 Tax=Paenibacillus larvae TaxID=1464 RepID=A0A6C0QXE0_9BACL|nr:CRISPR-associated protein Cas4 [Paenibacillus larvae]AQR76249.1 CRISPR-associated protein Cas4 [Paenibacillus larvae subsp. larvae]AVF22967.1 CRISPR-associated protein Cas4 [Paenibacillus larvae subsp. larvae]ETK26374.1 CRISPR-associated Cas4 family protein [Paenibacillus larvae subsp. larvae DSM 25719]MCY7476096.1 CRISPR-associated protein Cas4 [Paenibacillus larvae]MCY7491146.1 CRISPR-associated protein Cas4 [Paenibacillus larvae]
MKITGTVVNYYVHCRRQCWLVAHGMNFEDDSEDVRIGRVQHEIRSEGKKNTEIAIEGIKVDKLTDQYVVEVKKSDADVEATKWQTLYYLYVLRQKGMERQGRLEFIERNKQASKKMALELDIETEQELLVLLEKIEQYLQQEQPDPPVLEKKCKRCAYYAYCFV